MHCTVILVEFIGRSYSLNACNIQQRRMFSWGKLNSKSSKNIGLRQTRKILENERQRNKTKYL